MTDNEKLVEAYPVEQQIDLAYSRHRQNPALGSYHDYKQELLSIVRAAEVTAIERCLAVVCHTKDAETAGLREGTYRRGMNWLHSRIVDAIRALSPSSASADGGGE